jgi:hypothetical protein
VSSRQDPVSCDDERVAAIQQAFDAAWATIQGNNQDRDPESDCDLMAALSKRLGELAAGGISDPEELKRLALADRAIFGRAARGNK